MPLPLKHPGSAVVYKDGSTYYAEDIEGKVLSSSSTDASIPISAAAANIKNLPNIDTIYGGLIRVLPGLYECKTNINLEEPTTQRHAIKLAGYGWGTVLNFTPGTSLTDAITTRGTGNGIENLLIRANSNVTNLVHITSDITWPNNKHKGSNGKIEGVCFEGPNFENETFSAITGQKGILHDSPNQTVAFWWRIRDCTFRVMDTGIHSKDVYATSSFITDCNFVYCKNCIDIEDNQHTISNIWIQGSSGTTRRGIILRGGAGWNHVSHVLSEILAPATGGGTETGIVVLLESGANHNIISHIDNGYHDNSTYVNSYVVIDQSGNNTNSIQYYSKSGERTLFKNWESMIDPRKYGTWTCHDAARGYSGLFENMATGSTGSTSRNIDSTGLHLRYTSAATLDAQAGLRWMTITERDLNPVFRARFRLNSLTAVRLWLGFHDLVGLPTGSDGYENQNAFVLHFQSGGTNWKVLHNNGSASSTIADFAPAGGIAADTNIHTVEIRADNANSRWRIALDPDTAQVGGIYTNVTSAIPIATTDLAIVACIQTAEAVAKTVDWYKFDVVSDS